MAYPLVADPLFKSESGSAIPAGLPAGAQFTSHGLGIYTVQQSAATLSALAMEARNGLVGISKVRWVRWKAAKH